MSIMVLPGNHRSYFKSIENIRITIILNIFLLYCLSTLADVNAGNGMSRQPIVIVVSFDGFRYDYFKRANTTNMNYLSAHGVRVPFMMNQFVSKTFTNHQSIATGMYPESHGIMDNVVFDPKWNETLGESAGERFWNFNDDILPLWTLNELAGGDRRSGVMMWPGSNYAYGQNKSLPWKVVPWNDTIAWEWRVDTVIDWLTDPEAPVNLVFMYFEEPDELAHGYGPESSIVTDMILRADNITGYLFKRLKEHEMFDKVNLMMLSDHGFVEVKQQNIINISSVVDPSRYHMYGGSPVVQINPKNDSESDDIYQKFHAASLKNKHFSVYKKSNLPSYWHYQNNRRVMPIVLVADIGHAFDDFYKSIDFFNHKYNFTANTSRVYGVHGYDNRELSMHAFFLAHGPVFQHGVEAKSFDNIDLFPLICLILGINPIPANNGSLSHVDFLRLKRGFTFQSPVGWVFGAAVIGGTSCIFFFTSSVGLALLFGIMSMMIVKRRNGTSNIVENGNGYRFVNKDELMEILDEDEDEVEISGYRSVIHSGVTESTLKQDREYEDLDNDEIQALLLSSSNEEL